MYLVENRLNLNQIINDKRSFFIGIIYFINFLSYVISVIFIQRKNFFFSFSYHRREVLIINSK